MKKLSQIEVNNLPKVIHSANKGSSSSGSKVSGPFPIKATIWWSVADYSSKTCLYDLHFKKIQPRKEKRNKEKKRKKLTRKAIIF